MKTLTLVLLTFVSISSFSQKVSVNDIINKFEGKEGITTIVFTKDMLGMVSNDKKDTADIGDIIRSISGMKIMVLDKATQEQKDLFESLLKKLDVKDYKDLMVVKDGKKLVKMIVKETDGRITDFILTVTGEKEDALINISGNIDPRNLSDISKNFNINGLEHLKELDKNKN